MFQVEGTFMDLTDRMQGEYRSMAWRTTLRHASSCFLTNWNIFWSRFAGRECGIALAKMSFDEEHLDNVDGCKNLSAAERDELHTWIEKFKYYRAYPLKGRLVPESALPDSNRDVTKSELASRSGENKDIPDGYARAPIYIAAGGKVYDMSFGGVTFYGPGGPYCKFAGHDASRALATMDLADTALESNRVSDLSDKQRKTLTDWMITFEEKKGYPVVGKVDPPN